MADPTRLFIKATGSTHPFDQKYDIYHHVNGVPTRVNLCGFSFFSEIAGINLNALPAGAKGIDLRGPGDPVPNPLPAPPKYSLSFAEYLDKLRGARVNWARVFVFEQFRTRFYPFTGSFESNFNLHIINSAYIARLVDFVEKARARGIVVCISLFSSQMLSAGGFAHSPFNFQHNNNGVIRNPDGTPAGVGRNEFCKIEQPPGQPSPFNNNWTQPQKLWWIQNNLVRSIVNATKGYWNVAYEIMNEPNAGIANVAPWHRTVATWLGELLHDPAINRRGRLVVVNAADNVLDGLVGALLPAGQPPLFDVFAFHGGGGDLPSQWGGPHGRNRGQVCADPTPPPVGEIINGADETLPNGQVIHHRGILDAMNRFRTRPVALLFDTDAQYYAQKNVTPYVEEVLNVDGSYAYRWADTFLNAVADANCADLQPLRLGLDQRLAKISAARNRSRITVFAV